MSVDPVTALTNGDMRHFNRYAYAYNSPYSFKDPDGRDPGCGSRIEDHAAPACKSHYPSAGDGGGGGGGGGRDGSEVVNDYSDLPKLPPGVTWDEGWSGETWERVERFTGNKEIRWYEPDDGVKQILPLQLIASMLSNRMLAKVIVPNIEYATQSGLNHLEIQVGYRHVFSRIEHGVFEPSREIYSGYGIIWTNQTIWKPDLKRLDKPERKLWIQAEF